MLSRYPRTGDGIRASFTPPTCKPPPQTPNMDINVALSDKGLLATYSVEKEDMITYNIRLKDYSGNQPPLYIKLYKTEMGWSSAFEDADLVRELGIAIDDKSLA